MRHIAKQAVPSFVTEVACASTTNLSSTQTARAAFDQLPKQSVREALVREQFGLCAFCMRRVDADARDERSEPTMKIAHRTPIEVASTKALDWSNLLGSCDGGQRSLGRRWTCDAAQGSKPLTVDPTNATSVARLRYERRDGSEGLFITSDDPAHRTDVEDSLALNDGDLPAEREAVWKAFQVRARKRFPDDYGRPGWQRFLPEWLASTKRGLPAFAGLVEARIAGR